MLSKERVLIVGCGDIGQRLARELPAHLYQVTGIRRRPPADSSLLQYQACDATDAHQLAKVLQQGFAVIVVSMTPAERSDKAYELAYVQTCRNLVAGLDAGLSRPRLLVFVSSSAVYSQMDGSWIDESSPAEPESFSGKRLLEAEAIIRDSGYPHTILRFSGIYGPGRNRLIEQVRQGRASASAHFTNRIHADDCARTLVHLIELGRKGKSVAAIYLASDMAPAPMIEVVSWMAAQLNINDFLAADVINERGNKRCSSRRLLDSGFRFRYPTYRDGYAPLLQVT